MGSQILLSWAASLERQRELLPGALDAVPLPDLCRAIAQLQFARVLEAASAIYYRPKTAESKRAEALGKLRRSRSVLDRYAALLITRWDAQDAEDAPR